MQSWFSVVSLRNNSCLDLYVSHSQIFHYSNQVEPGLIKVAILRHSNLKGIPDPDGFWSYKTFQIETFCCPGATFDNITSSSEYKRLVKKNFDVIILFLGGNDIRNECNIADLYAKLKTLIDDLNNTIIPKFGIFFLEPEARLGNPEIVSQKGYYRLRNSLVWKVKSRKEIVSWTLLGRGLNLHHLGKDGVHFNKRGKQKFREIIQDHLDEKIAKIDEEKTRKKKK